MTSDRRVLENIYITDQMGGFLGIILMIIIITVIILIILAIIAYYLILTAAIWSSVVAVLNYLFSFKKNVIDSNRVDEIAE